MNENFETIQKLVKCLSGIDIQLCATSEAVQEAVCRGLYNISFVRELEQKIQQLLKTFVPYCIYEVEAYGDCRFIIVYHERLRAYLLAGPCLLEPFDERPLLPLLRRHGVKPELERQILSYFQNISVVSYDQFHQLGTLLVQLLFGSGSDVPYRTVTCVNTAGDKVENVLLVEDFDEIEKIRRVEMRYELSTALTEAVKQGNLSLAYWFTQQMDVKNPDLQRAPNHLRNAQNLCITTNTQLRHALENSGIHPYYLDALSSEIARQIEQIKSVEAAGAFGKEIIRRYCKLAQDNIHPNLKPFSKLAVTYVKTHLADNLTVKSVAKALMVTPDYLSTRFHQEVGMTFIEFLNRERVNQAAALLKHTNLQIQQIAVAVGYNHTSYFAKQFARYKHASPRAFRQDGAFL